jgi:GT2 family glycosyltransferase
VSSREEPAPVSVVVPTIGRRTLHECLDSIAASSLRPAEVVVVDQSRTNEVSDAVASYAETIGARTLAAPERGIGLAVNLGVAESRYDVVLVTHDDCTVDPSWVETAWELISADGDRMVTGRVRPAGDPRAVPSTKDHPTPQDFTGHAYWGGLMPMNVVFRKADLVGFGGFDERFTTAAEDTDLCYRWLLAGRRLHYRPELVVHHHDTRTPEELERVYVAYWRAQGRFYAKHLWRGDGRIVRFIARDLLWDAPRAMRDRLIEGRPRWTDSRRGVMAGLPAGLARGLWEFRPLRRAETAR